MNHITSSAELAKLFESDRFTATLSKSDGLIHVWIRDSDREVAKFTPDFAQHLAAVATNKVIEARIDEMFYDYTQTVGEPSTPIRSKFVKNYTEFIKARNDELKAQLQATKDNGEQSE